MAYLIKKVLCLSMFWGLVACSSSKVAFKCGPIFHNKKQIEKNFTSLVRYLDLQPGDVFADIAASSGYYDVPMAVLVDGVSFYIQDIDTSCLNKAELQKIVDYYSSVRGRSLEETNEFHLVIGETDQTNLPDQSFDKIYCNASFHVFEDPEKIVQDVHQKLKEGGYFFIRDVFSTKNKVELCSGKTCKYPLVKYDRFLEILSNQGFELLEVSPKIAKYPIHKFAKR